MRKLAIISLIMAVFAAGCSNASTYKISLKEVSTSTGETKQILASNCPDMAFSDSSISIQWSLDSNGFDLVLKNLTAAPVSVIWDAASLVDDRGETYKITHKSIAYYEENKAQTPSIIPPGTSLTDTIYPSDFVSWKDNELRLKPIYSSWWTRKPLGTYTFEVKSFQVLLPVQMGDIRTDYLFIFDVQL